MLRSLLERDQLASVILWGPAGTGKTSLAAVIAAVTDAAWEELSAVSAGVKDVRAVIERGRQRLEATGRRTVLFLDEIHRFNKAQQDALLPAVENRWIVLVGATTENPFFELNPPLISRCHLARLEPLGEDAVRAIVRRALADPERGYGDRVELPAEPEEHLVTVADGDARTALVVLEAAVDSAGGPPAEGRLEVSREDVHAALTSPRLRYEKAGDAHYDEISAFIKSMRGGDPDASVYWLLRMLEAGEDPRFLARRMVIFASEDVGLADRTALPTAVAAFEALDRVGLPEATFNLVHAAVVTATTLEVEKREAARIVHVNMGGTVEALEAARSAGARGFVYVSSPSTIGDSPPGTEMDESVPKYPGSLYGITKDASEEITRRYGVIHDLSVASVRIAQPYGPGERATASRVRTSPIYEWLLDAQAGRELAAGPLDRARDWTYIDDTARGIAELATASQLQHDLYHLGCGSQITVGEVIEQIRIAYPDVNWTEDPSLDALNPNIAGTGGRKPLDCSRFQREFGWVPATGIEEGMRRYLEWWKWFSPSIS
jgi:putative ATPase